MLHELRRSLAVPCRDVHLATRRGAEDVFGPLDEGLGPAGGEGAPDDGGGA
jgi:hypothetical protein